MNLETRLTLEILSESRISSYQRRYLAVTRFIDAFGIIPSFERIIKGLPKNEKIRRNVQPPAMLSEEIQHFEVKLDTLSEQNDASSEKTQTIKALDNLYDRSYRLSKM